MSEAYKICEGLNQIFPGNSDPFRILGRLMEESGELAQEIHHFEGVGRKRQSRSFEPSRDRLAKECMDVLTSLLSITMHYGIEGEFRARIEKHYRMIVEQKFVEPLEE